MGPELKPGAANGDEAAPRGTHSRVPLYCETGAVFHLDQIFYTYTYIFVL